MEGSLNTRETLQRTLDDLTEREDKLRPFISEAEEVKRAIAVIEKALDKPKSKPPVTRAARTTGAAPLAVRCLSILSAEREDDESADDGWLAQGALATLVGATSGGVKLALEPLRIAGEVELRSAGPGRTVEWRAIRS